MAVFKLCLISKTKLFPFVFIFLLFLSLANQRTKTRIMANFKRLFIFSFILFFSFSLYANNKAKELFLSMPPQFTPLLTEVNKADCIDFLASNMKAQVTNRLDGTSEMTQLSDDYIHIQMTLTSEWEMKLFPLSEGDYLISIIKTSCAPACDSQIQFYSSDWKLLNLSDYIQYPSFSDYIQWPTDAVEKEKLTQLLKSLTFSLSKIKVDAESNELTFVSSLLELLDKETAEKIEPYLIKEKKLSWNGLAFK